MHNAHLIIAEWIRDFLNLDAMYIMPTARPPHKTFDSEIVAISHRMKMIELAINKRPEFQIFDHEADPETTSYSVDTVRTFLESRPECRGNLYFIIGEDNLKTLNTWKEPEELSRLCRIVVARRPDSGKNFVPNGIDQPLSVETPVLDISSSMVRRRIREGKSIKFLVPEPVEKYIYQNQLFCAESNKS